MGEVNLHAMSYKTKMLIICVPPLFHLFAPSAWSESVVLHATCGGLEVAAHVLTGAGQRRRQLLLSVLGVRLIWGVWIVAVSPTGHVCLCMQSISEEDSDERAWQSEGAKLRSARSRFCERVRVCMCVCAWFSFCTCLRFSRAPPDEVIPLLPRSCLLLPGWKTQTLMQPIVLQVDTCAAGRGVFANSSRRVPAPWEMPTPAGVCRRTHLRASSASRSSFSSTSRAWRSVPGWPACCYDGREGYGPPRPNSLDAASSAGPSHLQHQTSIFFKKGNQAAKSSLSCISQRFQQGFQSPLGELAECFTHSIPMSGKQMWVICCKMPSFWGEDRELHCLRVTHMVSGQTDLPGHEQADNRALLKDMLVKNKIGSSAEPADLQWCNTKSVHYYLGKEIFEASHYFRYRKLPILSLLPHYLFCF